MALLTASALGKTIRENDIDSLYYFYGHDTAALESFTKRLVNKLCPADAQHQRQPREDRTHERDRRLRRRIEDR